MNKNLLIIGAGQYGMLAKEIAEGMGAFEKISFLDDNNTLAIGKIVEYERFVCDYSYAFVAIGNGEFRLEMMEKLQSVGFQLAVLVGPNAYISPSATIEEGCMIEPNATILANVKMEAGCFLSAGAVVNHNAIVERGCHIDCNATVTARSVVKAKTKVGSGQAYNSEAIDV